MEIVAEHREREAHSALAQHRATEVSVR
jgi:hypothetical protein